MFRQREGGGSIRLDCVAAITRIEVRRSGKLSRMTVNVAIDTALEFDFEERVFALRNVALCALQPRMSPLQRILGGGVLFYCKGRWFPAVQRMA